MKVNIEGAKTGTGDLKMTHLSFLLLFALVHKDLNDVQVKLTIFVLFSFLKTAGTYFKSL